jgi:hypothetical protein
MIPDSHIDSLVAHYLRSKGYISTLNAFEQETNKKFSTPSNDESLESIINDRINFQKSSSHATASGIENEDNNVNTIDIFHQSEIIKSKNIQLPNWSLKYPDSCEFINLSSLNSLIINSNYFQAIVENKLYNLALFVTNTKYVFIYDIDLNEILLSSFDLLNGQPIKIITGINGTNHLIICDMNGNLSSVYLSIDKDTDDWVLLDSSCLTSEKLKLHRRLITDFKFLKISSDNNDSSLLLGYFASIGWDSRITIGSIYKNKDNQNHLDIQLIGDYKLFTNPTSLLITLDKDTNLPVFLVGRLESSLLAIFTITSHIKETCKLVEIAKLSLNDSEFSSHSFQPMAIAEISSSNNDTILTIATDHVPYMRLITVVLPSIKEILMNELMKSNNTVFAQLSKIANDNPENNESFHSNTPILRSYILSNFNSLSPQDNYSNAIILSRPNCSGLWIPGDDGKLRGFDLRTGNVIETLNSNDGRAKSAFIGNCGNNSEVVVVCGAVDRKISIWRCSS